MDQQQRLLKESTPQAGGGRASVCVLHLSRPLPEIRQDRGQSIERGARGHVEAQDGRLRPLDIRGRREPGVAIPALD